MLTSDQPAAAGSCFDHLGSRHFGVVVAWMGPRER